MLPAGGPSTECFDIADVCFVVDDSGSIRDSDPRNWGRLKNFMKLIVRRLIVGLTRTRVGVVMFSNDAFSYMKLSETSNEPAVLRSIDELPYRGGNTNTSGGLYVMNHVIFQPRNGDRPAVTNIAIVITDGESTWDKHLTEPYAKEARDSGVKMITVGVTDKINMAELRKIASQPQSRTILRVGDYNKLITALDNLVGETCARGIAFVAHLDTHRYTHRHNY